MRAVRWLAGWRKRRRTRNTLTRRHWDGGYRISPPTWQDYKQQARQQ